MSSRAVRVPSEMFVPGMKTIKLDQLRPLDGFVSARKTPFRKKPVEWFFNELLYKKSKREWPNGHFLRANHNAYLVGDVMGVKTDFEWTFPSARMREFEDWRADPEVALVVRPKAADNIILWDDPVSVENFTREVFRWSMQHNGRWYDAIQTAGIYFNNRKLVFGGKYQVCSTGYRLAVEYFCGKFQGSSKHEVWNALPCDPVNEVGCYDVFVVDKGE